ncbi:uncharacterized protein LOC132159581 isoform X2 [Carassius carassius]|uniref:uncharacterized protein LOC132159581 isoform X2 n=1 Tax=Carassius carassius TaxID=217509 RepID=UPI00286905B2|nr:uncharacterized protein LOC132159581 isoform X2 [Carassius carassius]
MRLRKLLYVIISEIHVSFSDETPSHAKSERSVSPVSSSVSMKSDRSKGDGANFIEKTPSSSKSVRSGSHVSSSVSVKSDRSKGFVPNFSEKTQCNKSNKGQKSTVNIGAEITRWDALKAQKGLKSDVELATFLLNRVQFEKSDSNYKNYCNRKNFRENLIWTFKASKY